MHELSLTQAVVDAIAERMGDARVTSVRLEIGRLSGVVVDSIRFCFDLVAEGTTLHGARLEVDEPSGQARCRACDLEFTVDDPIVLCPACDSANVAVLSGCELRIISVEVEAACAEPAAARTTPSSS
jgi:hydrogenase nickel incorporation protein HypA/HybF